MEAGIEIQEDSTFQLDGVPQRFSYNELSEATGDFSKESILGHGGFGVVYRGELNSGIQVAIKRMNPEATQSQGMKEFKSEVQIISKANHRNLIELRGYCADGGRMEYMLVYDLMPNGSLDDALFNGTIPLSWLQKFKILTGAADGLSYLHQGLNQQVIHRDIKCSNILLDKELDAKLGDFGISRMVAHQGRAATTDMAGTMGYMAPEVFSENRFTDRADVYAFGVVILEVVCGRRVLPGPSSHDMNLVQWVWSCHDKGNLLSTVGKRYRDGDAKEIQRVLKVGLLCTQFNPQDRTSMRRVLQMLAGDVMVPSVPTSKATSGLLSARLKNLFYRKVSPGLASRSPQTVSLESEVESSASDPIANAGVLNNRRSAMNTSSIPTESGEFAGVQNSRRIAMNTSSSPTERGEFARVQNDRRIAMNTSSIPTESREFAGVQNDRRIAMNTSSIPTESGEFARVQNARRIAMITSSIPTESGEFAGVQNDRRIAMNTSSIPTESGEFAGVQNDRRIAMNTSSMPTESGELAGVQNDRRSAMNTSSMPTESGELAGVQDDRRSAVNTSSIPTENGKSEGRRGTEWVEQDGRGVYITVAALPGGGTELKRVRFSRKVFSVNQAEKWWADNRQRVHKQYNV